MEEIDLGKELKRVQASPDFERAVLTRLSLRKESRTRRQRTFRFAFAGAGAFLFLAFIFTSFFIFQKKPPVDLVELGRRAPGKEHIPITELVDYSHEIRNLSYEPQTIYILEQVSETSPVKITY